MAKGSDSKVLSHGVGPEPETKGSAVAVGDLFDKSTNAEKTSDQTLTDQTVGKRAANERAPMEERSTTNRAIANETVRGEPETYSNQANVTANEIDFSESRIGAGSLGRSRIGSQNHLRGSLEDSGVSVRGAIAFFVVSFIGILFIVTAKLSQLDPFQVVMVPVALMLAYACAMLAIPRLRLRDDQAGDNLYYLGFLFTLTSIGVSLYQFSGAASADEIVSNFGIAVTSTIAGLMLRIAVNQMRSDPAQVERVSRHELADASRRLRRELDTITREMSALGRTTHQKTKDILDVQVELVGAVKNLINEAKSSLNDADRAEFAKKVIAQLEQINESVRSSKDTNVQVIADSTKEIVTQVSHSTKSLLAELQKQTESSSAMAGRANSSMEEIGRQMQFFADSQQEFLRELSALNATIASSLGVRVPVLLPKSSRRRWNWLRFLRRNG